MNQNTSGREEFFSPEQEAAVKNLLRISNYYDLLGLERSFSPAQLKKARDRLALQVHPDKNKAPGSKEAFQLVGKAYDVLSDRLKKDEYDEKLRKAERKEIRRQEEQRQNISPKPQNENVHELPYGFIIFFSALFAICGVVYLIPEHRAPIVKLDYEQGFENLWGREALEKLREFASNGDIEGYKLKEMSKNMKIYKTYLENRNSKDQVTILNKMLKSWYQTQHYRLKPADSKKKLISVLEKSRCSSNVVGQIHNLLGEKNLLEKLWNSFEWFLVRDQYKSEEEVGLEHLFGGFALERLMNYMENEEISEENLEKMARQMGVHNVFSFHYKNVDRLKLLSKILEEWFLQTLHRLQPAEAKKSFVFVLKVSDCSSSIVEDMESALYDKSFRKHLWKVWKYFKILISKIVFY